MPFCPLGLEKEFLPPDLDEARLPAQISGQEYKRA